MSEEVSLTEQQFHRKMSVELFNFTWTLIEKPNRTRAEDDTMLHAAHASRFHWEKREDCKALNLERGEWQISRVWALLGQGESALYHALRCLEICEAEGIGDWDIAFAHEAVARAYAAVGDRVKRDVHVSKAEELGAAIAEKCDRDYFFEDLRGGPWFGMQPETMKQER